jgi:hypothetical protein
MVAPVFVIALTAILLMAGAAAAVVVKVVFAEVAAVPLALTETTSKSYRVLAVNPVRVTEWLVTNVVFSVVELPYVPVVP